MFLKFYFILFQDMVLCQKRNKKVGKVNKFIWIFVIFLLFSCGAPIVPPELKKEIVPNITISQVQKKPQLFKGKTVMWGGEILKSINKKEGTLFEVLALPLDRRGRPKQVDKSEGRFLILYKDYLDVAIYAPGRKITVIGEIKGIKKLPLGEIQYTYPFLEAKKIHLWELGPERVDIYHYWFTYPNYPLWYGPPYWYWP